MTAAEWQSKLMPSERLLWTGSPYRGPLLGRRELVLIPFSILWLGFFVVAGAVLWSQGNFEMLPIIALFIAFGGLVMVGRFFVDAWLRGRMSYALTNRRVLISRRAPFGSLAAIDLAGLTDVELVGPGKTRGTIRLGPAGSFLQPGPAIWLASLDPVPHLWGIDNAAKVFRQIQEASQAVRSPG